MLVASLRKVRVIYSYFFAEKNMDVTMVVIKYDSSKAESLRDLNWLLKFHVGKLKIHRTNTKRFKMTTKRYKMIPKTLKAITKRKKKLSIIGLKKDKKDVQNDHREK